MLCSFGFDSWVAQGTPVNIIVGSHVWVEDQEEAWIDGEVIEIKGNDATIVATDGRKVMFNYVTVSVIEFWFLGHV